MDLLDAEQTRERLEALSALQERLSFRMSRLGKLLDNHATRSLSGSRLNLTAYRILMVLSIFRETSAADLARLMIIDRAQVSRTVAELIADGMLIDRPDPTSKRRKLLRLTDSGTAELQAVRPIFAARQTMFQNVLNDEDLAGLTRAIDTLSRHLAQELDHPEAMLTTDTDTPDG